VSQNPGESVHTYNVRWNLERDLTISSYYYLHFPSDILLQSPRGTTCTFPRTSFSFSSQLRNFQRTTHLGVDSRFSELEDENEAESQCCQDLFFKFQTEVKVNWSPAQMKRLWNDKCCFRCGQQGHQWTDCKDIQPANPKAFQFANLISSDCSEEDDSIPEEDEIRSYLQTVETGYLN
jgi:hypothetical protein